MTRLKTLSLAAFLSVAFVAAGSPGAVFADDDDHSRFHRKWEKKHEKYHRRHDDGPPYGRARGYHRHSPTCGHDVYRGSGYGRSYGRYDAECGHIHAKAQKAREGLARWEGTGRHRDAVRAWHEVLQKTPQRLAECRRNAQARAVREQDRYRYGDRYPYGDRYDGYYDDYDYGDPYASGGYGDSFEWKRDWPFLLGGLLGQFNNRQ